MSEIIAQNEKKQNFDTLLIITGIGDLEELYTFNLPIPHDYNRDGDSYTIKYLIDGFFWTRKGINYLNDILARFILSFEKITYSTAKTVYKDDKYKAYNLKAFQNLNSIKKQIFNANHNKFEDNVFWSLKLFVEYYIRDNDYIAYSVLENYAFNHFVDLVKDKSTLKAKCSSIWNWYSERNFEQQLYEKKYSNLNEYWRKTMASRSENMKRINEQKKSNNYKKVVNVITGLFANDYKKKSGAWHIGKIAKQLNMSRNTVAKYIKEYEEKKSTTL